MRLCANQLGCQGQARLEVISSCSIILLNEARLMTPLGMADIKPWDSWNHLGKLGFP